MSDILDVYKNPRDKGFTDIINNLPLTLDSKDVDAFLLEVDEMFKKQFPLYPTDELIRPMEFWVSILNLEQFRNKVVKYVKDRPKKKATSTPLYLRLFRLQNNLVLYFKDDESFIRHLWKMDITQRKDFPIYVKLIRENLIPAEQIEESLDDILSSRAVPQIPTAEDRPLLESLGYFKKLYDLAFVQHKINDFDWANANRALIVYYIREYGLDENIVKSINSAFMTSSRPWHLETSLNELFEESDISSKYVELAKNLRLSVPQCLNLEW